MDAGLAIRFEQLSKTYGRGQREVRAVQDLDLEVGSGQVFGFLGQNGAGKTTTIRMTMDLIRPTGGRVYLFGQDVRTQPAVLKRAGALVEDAKFYGYLSGRGNLEVLAHTAGDYRPRRIESLLEQVGLTSSAGLLVGGYSKGMKQRLGIAAALLHDPELVILDEPTGGLDPGGMQETRRFIRSLAQEQGRTVFLSSHLLGEVEQICDRVAIIHQGRLVREGAVADLLAQGETELRLQVEPVERALQVLQESWVVSGDGAWLTVRADRSESPDIVRLLVEHQVRVYQIIVQQPSLEEYFMSVTQSE